jgi:hypothetical protein
VIVRLGVNSFIAWARWRGYINYCGTNFSAGGPESRNAFAPLQDLLRRSKEPERRKTDFDIETLRISPPLAERHKVLVVVERR